MKVEYALARNVYVRRGSPSPVPGDTEIPVKVVFPGLDEFGPKYVVTPLDTLFRSSMELLGLSFKGAELKLPRSGIFLPPVFPPNLKFEAYTGEWDYPDMPVPRVEYDRVLFSGRTTFDSLDTKEFSVEELEELVKQNAPLGGTVEIFVDGLALTFQDGFDSGKFYAHDRSSRGDGRVFDNTTRKLVVEPAIPWFNRVGFSSRIDVPLKDKSLAVSALLAKDFLVSFLDYQKTH